MTRMCVSGKKERKAKHVPLWLWAVMIWPLLWVLCFGGGSPYFTYIYAHNSVSCACAKACTTDRVVQWHFNSPISFFSPTRELFNHTDLIRRNAKAHIATGHFHYHFLINVTAQPHQTQSHTSTAMCTCMQRMDEWVCVCVCEGRNRNSQTFIGREAVGEKRAVLVLHFCQSETEQASEWNENFALPSTGHNTWLVYKNKAAVT